MALTISREDCAQYTGIAVLADGLWDIGEPNQFIIGSIYCLVGILLLVFGAHEQIRDQWSRILGAARVPLRHRVSLSRTIVGVVVLIAVVICRWFIWPPAPFALDLGQIVLSSKGQMQPATPVSPYNGTYVIAMVRLKNRGDQNGAVDWRLMAKMPTGETFTATREVFSTPLILLNMAGTLDRAGRLRSWDLDPRDQIFIKSERPIPKRGWVGGFAVFFFQDVPLSSLGVAGTLLTLSCKDVANGEESKVEYRWGVKNAPWPKGYLGIDHSFLIPAGPDNGNSN